jgi:putative transposase
MGLTNERGFPYSNRHRSAKIECPVFYQPPDEPEYPFHDRVVRVTKCGRICIGRRKINLSVVFAGQTVGIREVADKIWLVSFVNYDLGFFDEEVGRVEPTSNPFVPKL